MLDVSKFLKDVKNVAKTRKFWISMAGAAAQAVLVFVVSVPELTPLVGILTALGVYEVSNAKK